MKLKISHIILRSVLYYRTLSFYQFLIILFLSAIITGSLLTGSSVRSSLLKSNELRLYGTGITISSGSQYFPLALAERLEKETGQTCTGLLEHQAWVRNFISGESALKVQVFGVDKSFFDFNKPSEDIAPGKGEVIINRKLADKLHLTSGDDIIIRFENISDIPSNSPFAPEDDAYESLVLTVKQIINKDGPADFSLGISQVAPMNVFIPLSEFAGFFTEEQKINRILIKDSKSLSIKSIDKALSDILMPVDAGMKLRIAEAANQTEIISDRIFIGAGELEEISNAIPEARPLITYLANKLSTGDKSTPYSFVSALPAGLYEGVPGDNEIIINRWLADDLRANIGDSLMLSYYTLGDYKKLIENNYSFIIGEIVDPVSIWSDHTLMPEFPGISGSESCNNWDAGVPVNMDAIREKDEEYWNDYKGRPKAYINYSKGKELWANDFGPATAIRFPETITKKEVLSRLKGKIDPSKFGFTTINVRENAINAANKSVDFSTLFLSLSFFIIVSGIILLILVVSTAFESRRDQISTFRTLGFQNKIITKILFFESAIIAFLGSIAGMFSGKLFNHFIIRLLNSVWQGAVQTDTLRSYSDTGSMITGMLITFFLVLLVLRIKLANHLKVHKAESGREKPGKRTYIFSLLSLSVLLLIIQISLAIIKPESATILWFTSGITLFASMLLLFRNIIRTIYNKQSGKPGSIRNTSWSYYANYPSRAITPVMFLATGLFIIIITGANRKSFSEDSISRESGTGAYILWAETATPLMHNLNSAEGRKEYNIQEELYSGLYFIQAKRADGDDASCLNLNQVQSPPLLGLDITHFSDHGSFSFASVMEGLDVTRPWNVLDTEAVENTIYGIVDQTVLQWNLGKKAGDTLIMLTENGIPLNIIIAAGLKSSVFQGHILIGNNNFNHFFPSVSGSSVFLVDGNIDKIVEYEESLAEKFSAYGIDLSYTYDRLASFNRVSNTYLDVFMVLGGFGMIIGIIGLGFVLLRNFNLRKKEYALLLACGFTSSEIKASVRKEHFIILVAGIISGSIPALVATIPSLSSEAQIPSLSLLIITGLIFAVGSLTILLSVRNLIKTRLITSLKRD